MFKRKVNITRVMKGKKEEMQDIVLVESPIDVIINSEPFVNIICLPLDLKELSVGFLFSLGLIDSSDDIKKLEINELENCIYIELRDDIRFEDLNIKSNSRIIDTTCGIPTPWRNMIKETLANSKVSLAASTNIEIEPDIIHGCIKQLQIETNLYRETGGCHGAAIFDFNGNILSVKEDIGRHNAIDKVIGDLLLLGKKFNDKILISTGRLTGDSVLKAIRAKIPIVASLSAAIESGIRLAFTYGVTLIGFVRGAKMNIYTHPQRITIT